MKKYMDLTEEEPMFQGGFIWDYIDQSIYKKTATEKSSRRTAVILTTIRVIITSVEMVSYTAASATRLRRCRK